MTVRSCLLTCFAVLLASAGSQGAVGATRVHSYRVRIDPALSELAVEARLAGSVATLKAREFGAQRFLRRPRLCSGEHLRARSTTLSLPPGINACVRYEVDLQELARQRAYRRGGYQTLDQRASPASWLWQPAIGAGEEVQVIFELPAGVNVSVPWQPLGDTAKNTYRVNPSPESSDAIAVFGGFDTREIEVPGAILRVSLLRGEQTQDLDKLTAWLTAAAENVARVYGRFPNPSPQIVVVPVSEFASRSAVPFGRVIRDGGEAVQLFVAPDRPVEDYLEDWTATHEFSHLLLPYVDKKWISEGFASYYQNVLMARGGEYSGQRAWQKLHEGFQRGRNSEPDASPNEVSRGRAGLMKIYWSGAAIALMADVALRSSGSDKSLDSTLDALQACCLPSERMWGGRELFAELDRLSATSVFSDLYDRYADRGGFPPVETLYEDLGIRIYGDQVTLRDEAPLALIRESIMSGAATSARRIATREASL